jgi:hypothetical protein
MQPVIAEKIATYLAEIAATARTKRGFDRFVEKKALTLADLQAQAQANPMGYGAGLGVLGGGLIGGGSTALANLFREKADRKSVLNNALLGGIGGGALGLAGGSIYSAMNEPETQSKGNISTADRDKLIEKAKSGAITAEIKTREKQIADLNARVQTDPSVKGELDRLKEIQKESKRLEEFGKAIERGEKSTWEEATGLNRPQALGVLSAGSTAVGAEIGRGMADRDLIRSAAKDMNNKEFQRQLKTEMGPTAYGQEAARRKHINERISTENYKRTGGYVARGANVPNPTPNPATPTVRPGALRETLKTPRAGFRSTKAIGGGIAGFALPWILDAGASYMGINPETNRQDAAAKARMGAFEVGDRLSALGVK